MRYANRLFLVTAIVMVSSAPAEAAVTLYTDPLAWASAVVDIEGLDTTAAEIGLSDESAAPATTNFAVSNVLTFQAANTGLTRGFRVTATEATLFTWSDCEAAPGCAPWTSYEDALSPGDIGNVVDDDFRLELLDGATMSAFGVDISDSDTFAGETLALSRGGSVIETVPLSSVVGHVFGIRFVGVVASFDFDSVFFDEDSGSDDIAISNFRFATSPTAVPVPPAVLFLGSALMVLARSARRRT
ncbi:MAG: hypothetical protein H6977_02000 [Gammaproteobacteria bacterium]|nr:hypothetical protein [Gammaproteobacteria bacterium]